MNCPSSDESVKSEFEALMSLPSYGNKLSRMVVSTTYYTQVNLTRLNYSTLRTHVTCQHVITWWNAVQNMCPLPYSKQTTFFEV